MQLMTSTPKQIKPKYYALAVTLVIGGNSHVWPIVQSPSGLSPARAENSVPTILYHTYQIIPQTIHSWYKLLIIKPFVLTSADYTLPKIGESSEFQITSLTNSLINRQVVSQVEKLILE